MPQGRRSANRQAFYKSIKEKLSDNASFLSPGSILYAVSIVEHNLPCSVNSETTLPLRRCTFREKDRVEEANTSEPKAAPQPTESNDHRAALQMIEQLHINQMAYILPSLPEITSSMSIVPPQKHLSMQQMLRELVSAIGC